ncbi:MAG: methyltransferase domain-containing protein [Nanoarchaeota archaeon]|nr:methyltransferase domain-containing protein [Nanoarchaeota archaeon]
MAGLKDALEGKLTKRELSLLPKSFDVVGDILIFIDFPKELLKKKKVVADAVLNQFLNIKVVCYKAKKYGGEFRTPTLRILGGERRKETVHKENHIQVKLHVEKVYFSPRLATERERINHQIQAGESVLVLFSGCGVYPVNIAKNTKAKEIVGVEINPVAHQYALENLKLNKVKNVVLYQGDAKKVAPKIKTTFDRVLMPLPKSAEEFLGIAIPKVKKGGILHFYDFMQEEEFNLASEKIISAAKKFKRAVEVLQVVKCGQYGPGRFRVCVDARIH